MGIIWQNTDPTDSFVDNTMPRLLSAGKEFAHHTKTPRAMHLHPNRLEILLLEKGNGIHIIGDTKYQTAKGDIIIYNANTLHDEQTNTDVGMSIYSCSMNNVHLKGLCVNCLAPNHCCPVVPSGKYFPVLKQLMEQIYYQVEANHGEASEINRYLLCSYILIIHQLLKEQQPIQKEGEHALGLSIKAYLDAHYLEDLKLSDIADDLSISQFYLVHIFKAFTGYSPIQYIIRRRIGEAQTLLLSSKDKIIDIAGMVGFNNTNHFHNMFMKIVGMTPGKYRNYFSEK